MNRDQFEEADAVRVHGLTVRQIELLRQFYISTTGDKPLSKLSESAAAVKNS